MKKFLFGFILMMCIACGSDDNGGDTMEQDPCNGLTTRSGLSVTLSNASNGQAITGNAATVTATDGTFSEALQFNSPSSSYIGAQDREGAYVLVVTGDGFQTFVSETITVQNGVDCELVVTQEVAIALQPD